MFCFFSGKGNDLEASSTLVPLIGVILKYAGEGGRTRTGKRAGEVGGN